MKEKSCGAIVYKIENNEYKFLLVYQNNGHYSFPKGHVEEGESEIETALREIKEETNLSVKIDDGFRYALEYLVEPKNVMKDAVYFIATPISHDLHAQEGEISECIWCSFEEAYDKLNFENIREVFEKAYNYIKGIDK